MLQYTVYPTKPVTAPPMWSLDWCLQITVVAKMRQVWPGTEARGVFKFLEPCADEVTVAHTYQVQYRAYYKPPSIVKKYHRHPREGL